MIDNWNNHVRVMAEEWEVNEITSKLIDIIGDKDIAIVIWASLRNKSLAWIDSAVPILGGLKPIDMLQGEKEKDRLRWILLSGPWR